MNVPAAKTHDALWVQIQLIPGWRTSQGTPHPGIASTKITWREGVWGAEKVVAIYVIAVGGTVKLVMIEDLL